MGKPESFRVGDKMKDDVEFGALNNWLIHTSYSPLRIAVFLIIIIYIHVYNMVLCLCVC